MKTEHRRIAVRIREAFAGVALGDGIGLWQGQALDDYADDAIIAESRSRDETEEWTRLSAGDLNRCHSSLSFFDAAGMRFHLPAFLLSELDPSKKRITSKSLNPFPTLFYLGRIGFGEVPRKPVWPSAAGLLCESFVHECLTPFPHRRFGGIAENGKSLPFARGAFP